MTRIARDFLPSSNERFIFACHSVFYESVKIRQQKALGYCDINSYSLSIVISSN